MDVKLCECGCGEPAPIAKRTRVDKGHVRGAPIRFIGRHFYRINKGPKHHHWKGGMTINKKGYVVMQHPSTGDGFEHVLIAERVLGRNLPVGAVVHHVNGIPSDNSTSNLVICQDQAYHMLLHQRMRALKATGSPLGVKCGFCKQWGMPEDQGFSVSREGAAYHRSCNAEYEKARRMKKKVLL